MIYLPYYKYYHAGFVITNDNKCLVLHYNETVFQFCFEGPDLGTDAEEGADRLDQNPSGNSSFSILSNSTNLFS